MPSLSILAATLGAASLAAAGPARVEARASGTSGSTLPTITTKGNAFFSGDDRFYIRGVDYQPGGSSNLADPLADINTCSRDIAEFQKLGLNTIRVYSVDNSANHDQCMAALAEAGIYLALDVNSPNYSLNRDDPGPSYNPTYLQSVFATIDVFQQYSNTLLFFSGNEVINAPNTTNTAPYVKAVTRDMKQYIGERGYRSIPVGYSAADVSQNQYLMAQYMDCGDEPSRSDFYAINNYEWCDPSSYTTSGWDVLVQQYSNYSLPLFMSEYGCITNTRKFQETGELYKEEMTKVFSGGLVYEYSESGNGYGLVTIDGNSVTPVGNQFEWLQQAYSNAQDPSNGGGYTTTNQAQNCPESSEDWNISPFSGSSLPAMPSGAVAFLKNGAGTPPGLQGNSQNAGGASTNTAAADAGAVSTTYASSGPGATHSSAASNVRMSGPSSDLAMLLTTGAVFVSMLAGAALL